MSKTEQDNYILKYCQTTNIQRRRPTKASKNSREYATKYYVCKAVNRKLVPICFKSFLGILRLKKGRVQGVLKRHFRTGVMAKETRGGDRKTFAFAARKEAIEKFIQAFKPMETHYCRGKDRKRVYLSPHLSIKKLYNMYMDQALPGYSVTKPYFRKVFNTSFNIGFGSVRQDVCSTCLMLTENIKLEKNAPKKQELIVMKRIHSLRAKAFFNYLKEEKEGLLTISFDCQKNLPMPKVPDQSTYYSRQMYLYNFSVVVGSSQNKLDKENIFAYVWTEDMAAKSSNEICSALYHTLSLLPIDNATSIRLMADGCAGQNKNTILIGMLMKWFSTAPRHLKKVEVIFPVTGHSYMPPDRVFAVIEKKCRVHEMIVNPDEYKDIIQEHATIRNLGSDVPVHDWRTAVRNTIKTPDKLHFKISLVKRVVIKRSKTSSNSILVRGELSYNSDTGVPKSLLGRGKSLSNLEPEKLPLGVSVSQLKLTDVKNLLQKHYGDGWQILDSLSYFKTLLNRDNNLPQVHPNNCEGCMEEVIDLVKDVLIVYFFVNRVVLFCFLLCKSDNPSKDIQ